VFTHAFGGASSPTIEIYPAKGGAKRPNSNWERDSKKQRAE